MNPTPADFSSASSDAVLARAAQCGEKRAFVEIVARHQAMVCGVALGVLGDFAASEDAAQEAFLAAWRKIHELREPEKLRPWLAQIARNAALGHLRRTKGRREEEWAETSLPDGAADEPGPDALAVSGEEAALVREALARLPETYRLPLVLFYRQEQSVREVAATLEISEDAVKQRLARGRELLRERLSGVVETVLRRTQPGAIFTMSIAAAIGALMAPAAIAGSAFAAATVAGTASTASASTLSTTTTTTTTAAAMSTAKFSAAAALVAAACLPLGYAVHFGLEKPTAAPPAIAPQPSAAISAAAPDFPDSELFAEWVRLHEAHGHDAAAMPVLFQAIAEIKDAFRRRAFRAALVAEWAQVDPASGLDFFLGNKAHAALASHLCREWIARDAAAAVEKISSLGAKGHPVLMSDGLLANIARHAPRQAVALAEQLPVRENSRGPQVVQQAFAVLAERDLSVARAAAETLAGPYREEALRGVAKTWAQRDFDAAVAWAQNLPESTDRNNVLREVLVSTAAADSAKALENSRLVPPGGRPMYMADTTVGRILRATTEQDFPKVAVWLKEHRDAVATEDVKGLVWSVESQLKADPLAFLDQHAALGTLEVLRPALANALINEARHRVVEVWNWLQTQPEGSQRQALSEMLTELAGSRNPRLALVMAADLPATEEGNQQRLSLARGLLNEWAGAPSLDGLLARAPESMQHALIASAMERLNLERLGDPGVWAARFQELPEAFHLHAVQGFARAWAQTDPAAAAAWVAALPPGFNRAVAVSQVVNSWLATDSLAASQWLASFPPGQERDHGASTLAVQMAAEAPEEAWAWAMGIESADVRRHPVQAVIG